MATESAERSRFELLVGSFCSMRMWGFSLNRAWVYLMFLGLGASIITAGGEMISSAVYLTSSLSLIVVLFLGVPFRRRMERWLAMPAVRWLSVGLMAVGTLCATLLTSADISPFVLAIIGGVFTGVGSALLDLCYGELYRNCSTEETRMELPLSAAIAAAIFMLISYEDSATIAILITSLLPLFSGIILSTQSFVWEKGLATMVSVSLKPSRMLIARVGLCAAGVGIADGINREVFMAGSGLAMQDFYLSSMLPGAVLTALIIMGFVMIFRERRTSVLFKIIVFMIVGSIILAPALSAGNQAKLGALVALLGYNTFNIFIWTLLADLAYNLRLSGPATFGIGWGMLTVGHTAGQYIASIMQAAHAVKISTQPMISGFCALLALGACLFVLQDEDFSASVHLDEMVDTVGRGLVDAEEADHAAAVAAAEAAAAAAEAAAVVAANATAEADVRRPFFEACMELAKSSGLTPREAEVLALFARGRTAARIQEELYLSKGTVTSHLQHIYRKTGVHSKQELLDALEEIMGRA